jgi:DNA-binding NarL/FixJ family response regulator
VDLPLNRIVFFTEERILVEGCRSVLSGFAGLELLSESRLDALLGTLKSKPVHMLLLHVTRRITLETIQQLDREVPGCPVVLWVNDIPIELAYQALQFGVKGILRSNTSPERLIECFESILRGETWLDQSVAQTLLTAKAVALTPRESDVIRLVARGMNNRDIANALSLSPGTIKQYMSRLFRKLGVNDRFELAMHELRNTESPVPVSCLPETLSARERQLVELLPEGLRNKEIAARLSLTEGTVKVYFSRLFKKMGVNGRYQLALGSMRGWPPKAGLVAAPGNSPADAALSSLRSLVLATTRADEQSRAGAHAASSRETREQEEVFEFVR